MKKYHHLLSSQAIVDQIADSDLQFYGVRIPSTPMPSSHAPRG
jgi:hypothetical protein